MLNIMSKIMLFYNFKYEENHAFGRKKLIGSQKNISLFPAMPGSYSCCAAPHPLQGEGLQMVGPGWLITHHLQVHHTIQAVSLSGRPP